MMKEQKLYRLLLARAVAIALLFNCPIAYSSGLNNCYLLVLGVAQDGGYPHMGCQRACCSHAWQNFATRRFVVSLALVDSSEKKWWLLEATPDIRDQLQLFRQLTGGKYRFLPDGIFVTHAHIGHYAGLMQLGKEVMGASEVPVFVLPRMKQFLVNNGPWSQLVSQRNIVIHELQSESRLRLSESTSITAFTVPHRDEYSETAGFRIDAGNKKYLFIPDINKWALWKKNVVEEIIGVDIALVDATFLEEGELPGRNMDSVPHPFVSETMRLFSDQPRQTRRKVHFIHLNHTNPLLWDTSRQNHVIGNGFNIARQGSRL